MCFHNMHILRQASVIGILCYTVCKMNLILLTLERMLKMQFSIASCYANIMIVLATSNENLNEINIVFSMGSSLCGCR
jgi:hypothetical protein